MERERTPRARGRGGRPRNGGWAGGGWFMWVWVPMPGAWPCSCGTLVPFYSQRGGKGGHLHGSQSLGLIPLDSSPKPPPPPCMLDFYNLQRGPRPQPRCHASLAPAVVFTWPRTIMLLRIIDTTTTTGHVGHARPCAGRCTPGLAAVCPLRASRAPKSPGVASNEPWGRSLHTFSLPTAALPLFCR